ncbi:MAG: CARDB domain-containing protein [Bacteroides caccae]|nr:CARDB domain-containing protein [Bacteroides caccae]MDU3629280.1 CARDB domain-containing protein [Bacteroides caccae]MDU3671815.1 CARDB domain-containing protein [Bacteroides caccae]
MNVKFGLLLGCLFPLSLTAQVTERERPKEWDQLITGARYLDRFEAMPDGKLEIQTWGAEQVRPRFVDNGIECPEWSFWGGNILKGEDRKYHLFVCGWPETASKGHMEWPNSTVFHAVSSQLHGPYEIADTIGKGHNPEAFRLKDGRIVVYVINGYYVADHINGPWKYGKFKFYPRDRRIIEGLSNLSFAKRQDGSYLMVCRGGGIWVSRDGIAPYEQLTDQRVYPSVAGEFEDPVIWRDSLQYHLIVNDWLGRIAFYQRSKDGLHWIVEPGEAYVPGISFHRDGKVEKWFKYERPKVFQDAEGRVEQMNFAVIDTIKWEDHGGDRHSSKNICIPMNKGLLLSVLNSKPITADTRTIEVMVKAESGFDPHRDMDVASLRFGSFREVNYGKGCRVIQTRRSGKDLILVFDGKGSGITTDEFAPKLIGKDKEGRMLYGYARLPYVDYLPPILSAMRPVFVPSQKKVQVEVQNFGLSPASDFEVEVFQNGVSMGRSPISTLQSYEKEMISFTPSDGSWSERGDYQVKFVREGQVVETNNFRCKE